MTPPVPPLLLDRAAGWDELHRWERSELGKELRRLGLTYGEIRELIPVPKGTLSHWCRDTHLTADQIEAIKARTGAGSREGIPVDTQWRRREEINRIREEARTEVPSLVEDPRWVAGTMLYWAEGSKTKRQLALANTDADVLRIFIAWTRRFHSPDAAFSLMLHLHEGNNEAAARQHWTDQLSLPEANWHKTFIKPQGTGHRKNQLAWGVCRAVAQRSTDAFVRTMGWIEALKGELS